MTHPKIDDDPGPVRVLTGHFRQGPGYAVRRATGSTSWLLILTLAGSGRLSTRAGVHITEPGELTLLRPLHPHEYGTHGNDWDLLWAHFTPRAHWSSALDWPEVATGLATVRLDPDEAAASRAAMLAADGVARSGGLGEGIALALLESVLLRGKRAAGAGETDPRVARAMREISRRLTEPYSASALGVWMGLSPSRAARLFSDVVGEPPRRFQERVRLDHARASLRETGRSVKEIARDVGFESEFYFSRRYRERWGRPPSADRGDAESAA